MGLDIKEEIIDKIAYFDCTSEICTTILTISINRYNITQSLDCYS
jgi:hypothetical protein